MKVVAFNGSPRKEGNTWHAINMVAEGLKKENIEVEIIQVGDKAIRGCLACNGCARNQDGRCVIQGDEVNDWIAKMSEADGVIIGSPVHFSGIGGTMKSFLDRAFYVLGRSGALRYKVGTAVVAVRRSGGVATYNQLNNFINYAEMLVPTSNYWNVIHGTKPGDAIEDEEGAQIMRVLGKNMAWLMKATAHSISEGELPERENKVYTNFIR